MAVMTGQAVRFLGFAPRAGADALRSALARVPGPAVRVQAGPAVAALLQVEPDMPAVSRGQKALLAQLHTIQRRLEIACQTGPFLPMDPSAACCPPGAVAKALNDAWDDLAGALEWHGSNHQWDIVLRWSPEAVVARHRDTIAEAAAGRGPTGLADAVAATLRADRVRREQALTDVLAPAVLAFAPGGPAASDSEVAVTVLLRADGEAAVEAALGGLDEADATLDMRGPLPPLSFAAVRLAVTQAQEVVRAWDALDLPSRIDPDGLHRRWRLLAASAHPDRQPAADAAAAGAAVSGMTAAYHLLKGLAPASSQAIDLDGLLRRAGHRLVVPSFPKAAAEQPEPVMEAVS
jgi:hypothetical protein